MHTDNLVNMANRIGDFFAAMPDPIEARDGVAIHIRKFWDPRMRRQILALLDTEQGASLSDLVAQALREHRAELQPA